MNVPKACLSLLVPWLMATPLTAEAKPVRCNGLVQFRPCGQPLANGRSEDKPVLRPLSPEIARPETPRYDFSPSKFQRQVQGHYAEVVSQTMSVLAGSLAQWKGEVRGNGSIHLQLLWYRDGILNSSRYMGSINLVNKSTRYAFRSTFPRGEGWSWKVAAYATALSRRDF